MAQRRRRCQRVGVGRRELVPCRKAVCDMLGDRTPKRVIGPYHSATRLTWHFPVHLGIVILTPPGIPMHSVCGRVWGLHPTDTLDECGGCTQQILWCKGRECYHRRVWELHPADTLRVWGLHPADTLGFISRTTIPKCTGKCQVSLVAEW